MPVLRKFLSPSTPQESNTVTTTKTPIAARIAELRDEAEAMAQAEERDPLRAADDLGAWHARQDHRRRRGVEIEAAVRDLEEWGSLVDSHRTEINAYTSVVRPIARSLAYPMTHRLYEIDRGRIVGAQQAVIDWLGALKAFARPLDMDDENVKRVLRREVEQWFRARDGVASAEANHWSGRVKLPHPEMDEEGLPPFLRWGVHRLDSVVPA